MPIFRQLFVTDPAGATGIDLDRKLFIVRKRIEHELPSEQQTYFPSLSCRTLIYKGMLTTPQLAQFFLDLSDERFESAIALVHSRFSTNTFPSWPLAHPYRYLSHNGEINTVQGNRNWMRTARACWPAICCRAWSGRCQSARQVAATRRASMRCWNCCISPGAACRTQC